jgi:CTP:molybdopterin cytidylyltransferase MocA
MIDYALEASGRWHPLVVAGPTVVAALCGRDGITSIENTEPERGMSHSLKLADAHLPRHAWLMLLLGDKPLVSAGLIDALFAAVQGADVVYPIHPRSGVPGHPVLFGPRARAKIASLGDGDTIHRLRDDPSLIRRAVPTSDEGAFFDVDAL